MMVTDEKAAAGAIVGQLGGSGALGSVRGMGENGLLEIDLERRVPETMKPRRIEIGVGKAKGDGAKTISQAKAA